MYFLLKGHKIRPAYDFDYVALDLLTIYAEEGGVYTCHARNAYGEAETSASVKVTRKFFRNFISIFFLTFWNFLIEI